MQRHAGFTLIEIMITLIIATILIATTAPSLLSMIQNNRMVSLHNDLLSDLALTRSTAVTRGNNATICASNTHGNQCLANSTRWSYGWIVFDDLDNDGAIDTNETILATKQDVPEQLQMIGNSNRVSFDAEGSAFGFAGEFAFCDSRGEDAKRGLVVSNSGRSRVAKDNEISVTCP